MSNIPNSAMPHAYANQDNEGAEKRGETKREGASSLLEKARANPAAVAAAGAAVVAGAAALAVPLVRASRKTAAKKSKG